MQYLYGAAVQGIQQFIFQTNELKDIVGASELVENICTVEFDEYARNGEHIINAAGNIKYLFNNEDDCKKAVLEFPQRVMSKAIGITISQAVVKVDDSKEKEFGYYVDLLESKLRSQRNKPVHPLTLGMIGTQRSRTTGMPESALSEDGKHQDIATVKKRAYTDDAHEHLCEKIFCKNHEGKPTTNISKLTGQNDWIAIIHADGNGLGMVVSKIGKDKDLFLSFSKALNSSTEEAAQSAYDKLNSDQKVSKGIIPIRPIVLGGDDLTVVCRADIAIPFAKEFMLAFEAKTEKYMKGIFEKARLSFTHLTACAGIAYIKSSYPFYYGYNLAETMCDRAKADAKKDEHLENGLAPSCLMFHKVQDSFVESYKRIAQRELTPCDGHSYEFGPYYVNKMMGRWTVDKLQEWCGKLAGLKTNKEGNAVKSHLRQWLSLMKNPDVAEQKTKRVIDMLGDKSELSKIVCESTGADNRYVGENDNKRLVKCYPVYDILSMVSLLNQNTKSN